MMVYKFKDAAHLPAGLDAQAIGNRIAKLKESEGSGFTPEKVVEDARPESSPLHSAFTWDDHEAAERHRLSEAGYLVRSIVVVYRDEGQTEDREVRAFIPVTIRDVDEQRFLPILDAMSDDDYRRQVVERALGEMLALRRKYQDIQEFGRIWKAVDQTAKAVHKAA